MVSEVVEVGSEVTAVAVGDLVHTGTRHRHAPLWDRRRVLATATRLLYTGRVSVARLLDRRFPLGGNPRGVPVAGRGPQASVKTVLVYGGGP